ncbi:MAG: transposase [Actinomycetota bacterium]|nr:transposase [Actinomycetota bacterium]
MRPELLDRTLIWNQRQLERLLHEYVEHYNAHRPHRSLGQRAPNDAEVVEYRPGRPIRQPPTCNGLINQYRQQPELPTTANPTPATSTSTRPLPHHTSDVNAADDHRTAERVSGTHTTKPRAQTSRVNARPPRITARARSADRHSARARSRSRERPKRGPACR